MWLVIYFYFIQEEKARKEEEEAKRKADDDAKKKKVLASFQYTGYMQRVRSLRGQSSQWSGYKCSCPVWIWLTDR